MTIVMTAGDHVATEASENKAWAERETPMSKYIFSMIFSQLEK
jgi:hypothetical protein